MAKFLERMFVLLVTITLVLCAVSAAAHWLGAAIVRASTVAAPGVASIVGTFIATCFAVGLVVRAGLWLQDRRRAAVPRHGDRDRRARTAVRRLTEEPRGEARPRGLVDDADPALLFGEEDER